MGDTGSGGGGRGEPSSSYTGRAGEGGQLAERFGGLARALAGEEDPTETLTAIAAAALTTVPGATHASICAIEGRRRVATLAATSELARAVDAAQYQTGQGPCLDTLYTQATVRVPDMGGETRWPEFTARALELGVGSTLAIALYADADDLGALNLHSGHVNAFADESEHVGLLLAAHAAVALAAARQRHQLRHALATRDVIGMAKGILMERYKLSGDRAFAALTRASQQTNRKLRDIAEELVAEGTLPGQPG